MRNNQSNYLTNPIVDIDSLIAFVKSKKSDNEFIKQTLINSGVYDKDMKLTEKYKRVE